MMDGMDDPRMQEIVLIEDWNRKSGNPELVEFINRFESDCNDFEEIIEESGSEKDAVDEMIACFDLTSKYGDDYTPSRNLDDWKAAVEALNSGRDYEPAILSCLTGKKYKKATIRGCCQSDWADIIYPEYWPEETLESFESEYFNLGSEWTVTSGDDNDEFTVYINDYDIDGIKSEIADIVGTKTENICLKAFDGYDKVPKYHAV